MSGYIFKYQLAMAYFPEVKPETASKLLSKEITRNASLMAALQATGYDHRTPLLSKAAADSDSISR